MSTIYVGTSSWADHEHFYPADLPSNQQIAFYAQHYPIVEINSTFYALMPPRNFQLWTARTPKGFVFDVKPFRQLTWHDREHPPTDEVFAQFSQSLQPLRDAEKLGAINLQFPPWFKFEPDNVAFIRRCCEAFPEDRISVEFRHRSWLEGEHVPDLLATLREDSVGLTVVDEPQVGSGSVPTVLAVTNPALSVVRFHGRNAKTWYKKVERTADRFDYLYSEAEILEWVPKVRELAEQAREIHVLFNNNKGDYAVRNAHQLRLLLQETLKEHEIVSPTGPAQLSLSEAVE
jgi:uncharacterized protein YecE (DUF72 family)